MHYGMFNVTDVLQQPQILRQYFHSTTIYVNVTYRHFQFWVTVSPRKVQCCVLVSPYKQTNLHTPKVHEFCSKKARNEMTGWVTSTTCTPWAQVQTAHRNPKTEHQRKNILFSFLLHNILMPRKTTELSSGTSAQERAWLEI